MAETTNYTWELPLIGASAGAWGTILNEVIGGTGTPPGIDAVLKGIQDEVDAAETDVTALTVRVAALEAAGVSSSFYARRYRASGQTIPADTSTQVTFDTTSFDQGDLANGATLVVPAAAGGVYSVRAQIEANYHSGSDNSRQWTLELHKNGGAVATAKTPALNDGVSSGGGNITLAAEYLDATAAAGDIYTARVQHSVGAPSVIGGADATFIEAVRLLAT